MFEGNTDNDDLEGRIKRLETLQRNTRIAIIILVGYSIYDVISKDSGAEIVYAHKIKAKEFELVDGIGTIFGSWKLLDEKNRVAGLVIENAAGDQVRLVPDSIKLLEGRTNSIERVVLDQEGLHVSSQSVRSDDLQQ